MTAEMLELRAKMELMEARLESLRTQQMGQNVRNTVPMEGPLMRSHYDGPFAGKIKGNGGEELDIQQGYVYAGDFAEYDWPQDGVDDYDISALGEADGDYYVYMAISVDEEDGYFTEDNKPVLGILLKDETATPPSHHNAGGVEGAPWVILGVGTIVDDKWTKWRQRWRGGDIWVPVYCSRYAGSPNSGDQYFYASWVIPHVVQTVGYQTAALLLTKRLKGAIADDEYVVTDVGWQAGSEVVTSAYLTDVSRPGGGWPSSGKDEKCHLVP